MDAINDPHFEPLPAVDNALLGMKSYRSLSDVIEGLRADALRELAERPASQVLRFPTHIPPGVQ